REIDVHEPESHPIPFRPFVIVHERPRKVTAYVHAFAHRGAHDIDVASDVAPAVRVVDGSVRRYHVVERGSVLVDVTGSSDARDAAGAGAPRSCAGALASPGQ